MFPSDRDEKNNNYKVCVYCKRRMPLSYEREYCPGCEEIRLFHDVKDFIRANDVNEYQVAEFFSIPVSKVKGWIREGRIEYRTRDNVISTMHCQRCGAPVTFGTLCPQCMKLINKNMQGYGAQTSSGDDRMRFLNQGNDKKR